MRRTFIYPTMLAMLVLLMAGAASAADYALVGPGKEIKVCQLYLQNLNSFPGHPPMVCHRPLNPKFPDFKKPDWDPLDVMKNLSLLEQMERDLRRLTPEQFEKIRQEWRASVKTRVTEFHLDLAIADLDVDGDRATEAVVRYDSGTQCDPDSAFTFMMPSGTNFYVLTPDRARIDPQKTRWLGRAGRPDLFLYKGQVFVSSWAGNLGFKGGSLHVGTTLAVVGEGTIVCDYNYQGVWPRRQP